MNVNRRSFLVGGASAAALAAFSLGGASTALGSTSVSPAVAFGAWSAATPAPPTDEPCSGTTPPWATPPARVKNPSPRSSPAPIHERFRTQCSTWHRATCSSSATPATRSIRGAWQFGVRRRVFGVSLIAVIGNTECGGHRYRKQRKTGELPHRPSTASWSHRSGRPPLPARATTNDAIAANARYQAQQIQNSSPTIAEMTAAGTLGIVSGVYGVASGRVTWLPSSGPPSPLRLDTCSCRHKASDI